MIHIAAEVYTASPAAYERVRDKLGQTSPTTVRRKIKERDFEFGASPELRKYVMKMVKKKTTKAEILGDYVPSRVGKHFFSQ